MRADCCSITDDTVARIKGAPLQGGYEMISHSTASEVSTQKNSYGRPATVTIADLCCAAQCCTSLSQ